MCKCEYSFSGGEGIKCNASTVDPCISNSDYVVSVKIWKRLLCEETVIKSFKNHNYVVLFTQRINAKYCLLLDFRANFSHP